MILTIMDEHTLFQKTEEWGKLIKVFPLYDNFAAGAAIGTMRRRGFNYEISETPGGTPFLRKVRDIQITYQNFDALILSLYNRWRQNQYCFICRWKGLLEEVYHDYFCPKCNNFLLASGLYSYDEFSFWYIKMYKKNPYYPNPKFLQIQIHACKNYIQELVEWLKDTKLWSFLNKKTSKTRDIRFDSVNANLESQGSFHKKGV